MRQTRNEREAEAETVRGVIKGLQQNADGNKHSQQQVYCRARSAQCVHRHYPSKLHAMLHAMLCCDFCTCDDDAVLVCEELPGKRFAQALGATCSV